MKFNFKFLIILTILITPCLCIGSTFATDISVDDITGVNSVDNTNIEIINDDLNQNDNEINKVSEPAVANFTELKQSITNAKSSGSITLNKNYKYLSNDNLANGITIDWNNFVIDGNGFTIDGSNSSRAFYVTGDNVTIKNIKFINTKSIGDCGAIFWFGDNGCVSGCNFTNSLAEGTSVAGGAIYWYSSINGKVINCNFNNCFIHSSGGSNGGAIYWFGNNGCVSGCNFTNCSASNGGGAIYWYSYTNGTISNCNFNNCSNSNAGSAIYWYSSTNGKVINCNFNNCNSNFGGAIYWYLSNYGNINNCSFNNSYTNTSGGAIYWISNDGNISNCSFNNSSAKNSGGAIYWSTINGKISNCSFNNSSAKGMGGAIYWSGDGSVVSDCNFTNSHASNNGGAIYRCDYEGGCVNSCNFINSSTSWSGGAICWASTNGCVNGCSFVNSTAYGSNCYGSAIYITIRSSLNIIDSICTSVVGDKKAPIYNKGTILSDVVITTLNGKNKFVKSGDNIILTANVTTSGIPVAGGIITLKVNNFEVNATSDFNGLYSGSKQYTVDFVGAKPVTGIYLNSTGNQNINAYNITCIGNGSFVVSVDDVVYGDNFTIVISDGIGVDGTLFNGSVIVTINGKDYEVPIIDGVGSKVVSDILPASEYPVNASLTIPNYNIMEANTTFIVNKANPTVSIDVSNITYGDDAIVTVTVTGLDDKAVPTGNVTFYLGTDEITVHLNGSTASYTFTGLSAGDYYGSFRYNGDNNYSYVLNQFEFNVAKADPNMTVDIHPEDYIIREIYYGDFVIATANLPDDATGTLYFSIDNVIWIPLNVTEDFAIPYLDAGNYTLFVKYSGDNNYLLAYSENPFTVHKLNTTITVNPVSGKAGEKVNITAKVVDSDGNPVEEGTITIEFNGEEYKANVVDGIATVEVVLPKAGNYSATAYYEGLNHESSSTTFTVEVIDVPGPNPSSDDVPVKVVKKEDKSNSNTESAINSNSKPDSNPTKPTHRKDIINTLPNTGNPLILVILSILTLVLGGLKRKL